MAASRWPCALVPRGWRVADVRRLARACLRLYPRRWRERYGDELRDLVGELDGGEADLLDLVRGAAREWVREAVRGPFMNRLQNPWSGRLLGGLALLLVLPSTAFVALNLLRYQFGLLVDESSRWWIATSSGAAALLGYIGGPVLALVVSMLGMADHDVRREAAGGLVVTLRVRRRLLPMLAALISVAVLAVIVVYGVTENLLEALR